MLRVIGRISALWAYCKSNIFIFIPSALAFFALYGGSYLYFSANISPGIPKWFLVPSLFIGGAITTKFLFYFGGQHLEIHETKIGKKITSIKVKNFENPVIEVKVFFDIYDDCKWVDGISRSISHLQPRIETEFDIPPQISAVMTKGNLLIVGVTSVNQVSNFRALTTRSYMIE